MGEGWRGNEREGGELDGNERERTVLRKGSVKMTERRGQLTLKPGSTEVPTYPNKRKKEEVLEAMNTQIFLEPKEEPREVLSESV